MGLIDSLFESYSQEVMDQVLKQYLKHKTITAVGFRDMAKQTDLNSQIRLTKHSPSKSLPPLSKKTKEKLTGI